MSLTCPRCKSDVTNEALYCSYCSLPKPRGGFAAAEEASPEQTKRIEQPKPPVGFKSSKKEQKRSSPPSIKARGTTNVKARVESSKARRLRLPLVSVAALVALLSVGIYVFVVPLVYSEKAEPKVVMSALDTLRRMPSNEAGLTIDARLTHELEKARRFKNLVSYQGWTVQPIKGTTTEVLLVFSYQEVGGLNQRAEWIADLISNTFVPQTDLASSVSGKK